MNKRIREKIGKRKNLERHNALFEVLKENGFTVYDKIYLDGYFLWDFGKSAVVHFKVKEIKDYLFGIWLRKDGKYDIFADHEEFIDKFKPTRTEFYSNNVHQFVEKMKDVRDNYDYYLVNSYLSYAEKDDKERIEFEINKFNQNMSQKKTDDMNDWKHTFNFFRKGIFEKIPEALAIGIMDTNVVFGGISDPRFDIVLQVEEDLYKELEKNHDLIDFHALEQEVHKSRPLEDIFFSKYQFLFMNVINYPIEEYAKKNSIQYIYYKGEY